MSDVPHEGTERPARATRAQIEDRLVRELAARLSVPVDQVDPARELATYGLPSVDMVGLVGELEAMVGRELSATLVWEYPTIEAIAEHICDTLFLRDRRVEEVSVKIVKLALSEADEKIGITLTRGRR